MIEVIIFITSFYLLLLSTLGFGLFFYNICFKKLVNLENSTSIYVGFFGLFFLTLVSLLSSLFVAHGFFHNIITHLIGISLFIFISASNKKKFLNFIVIISILSFLAVLISKTHDDFSYYHFPFTKYLTEQKIIFGMGHLNHGYNLLSSLFFLNSTFYLPYIEYYSFHFSLIFFLIFFNYFVIKEIQRIEKNDLIKYLYIFAFVFFNLSFNRLAEYGTDKAGQLLIVLIIIKLFELICFDKEKKNFHNVLFLIPLLGFCISLKSYFLPYMLLGFLLILIEFKNQKKIKLILFSYSFLFFLILLFLNFLHHFISTGCIVSPLSFTCLSNITSWGKETEVMKGLSVWLEQWAKAGAGPNFRVENVSEYIQKLNWVPNWFDRYFLVKFLDQLALLISSFIVVFFLLKKIKLKKNNLYLDKKFLYFYTVVLLIFLIWFLKHPTLRYGGYSVVFLIISIPVAFLFDKFENKFLFEKKFTYLVILVVFLFNVKNLDRINKEFQRGDLYKFSNFPFYSIEEKKYSQKKFNSGLTIYGAHHCWATPSPCGHLSEELKVSKKNGYFFISKF